MLLLRVMFAYIRVSADWNDDKESRSTFLELKEDLMVSCLRKRPRGTITCSWTVSWQRLWIVQDLKPYVHETLTHPPLLLSAYSLLHFTPSMEGDKGNVCVRVHACVCLWLRSIHACVCACVHTLMSPLLAFR